MDIILLILEREREGEDIDTGVLLFTPATPAPTPQFYERERINNIMCIFDLLFGLFAAYFAELILNFGVIGGNDNEYECPAILAAYLPINNGLVVVGIGIYFILVCSFVAAFLSSIIGLISGLSRYENVPALGACTTHNNYMNGIDNGPRGGAATITILGVLNGLMDVLFEGLFTPGIGLINGLSCPRGGGTTITIMIGFLCFFNGYPGFAPGALSTGSGFVNGLINKICYPLIGGLKTTIIFGYLAALTATTATTEIGFEYGFEYEPQNGVFCATINNDIECGLISNPTRIGVEFSGVFNTPNTVITEINECDILENENR